MMRIYYSPTDSGSGHQVLLCYYPDKTSQPAPDAPFVDVDEVTNVDLYWDVTCNPKKYLIDEVGTLSIDPKWNESAIV